MERTCSFRAERKRAKQEQDKLAKAIKSLTPTHLKLIDYLSDEKANEKLDATLDLFKELMTKSLVEAMRKNRISLERAEKVINMANESIEKEVMEE